MSGVKVKLTGGREAVGTNRVEPDGSVVRTLLVEGLEALADPDRSRRAVGRATQKDFGELPAIAARRLGELGLFELGEAAPMGVTNGLGRHR